ncbi:MAG: DUF4982 domain-containing protein [Lachnospiraceae bacterium]|nr:DUF4982 domain-containing protein [Lachnospiraceae bacterium]
MKIQKWNDNWKFWEIGDAFALMWRAPENEALVNLPHDGMLAHEAHAQSAIGGRSGYRDGGHFGYSKNLFVNDIRGRYYLTFDGVYENAALFVNAQLVCRHPYGYTQFYADITDYLKENAENEIRIVTNNTAASCRWYPGGGIYRDVYLNTSEGDVFIIPDGIAVKTLSIDGKAELEVKTTVKNASSEAKNIELKACIRGTESTASKFTVMAPGEEQTVIQNLIVDNPRLWSENTPELYYCDCTLGDEGREIDSDSARFGIRMLKLDPSSGLSVNGVSVKLRGACIHHDNGLLGSAEYKDAELRRVKIMKEAGFNAIRTSHNPASRMLLEACDELGMYIMDEAFDMWTRNKTDYDYANYFPDWWERDIEAMVQSAYNHPSVVIYSLGNEIPELGTPAGVEVCRMLADKVKELDDTRFTTVGINAVFAAGDELIDIVIDLLGPEEVEEKTKGNVNQFLTLMDKNNGRIVTHDRISKLLERATAPTDICGYNYLAPRYLGDVEKYPDRIIVGSETYPPEIAANWNKVMSSPQLIGDFTWTGWDYIGEAGVGIPGYKFGEGGFGAQFPCQLAYVGDIDITGFRRPASYYREIAFRLRKDPYIAVQDPHHYGERLFATPWVVTPGVCSWNHPGMEGRPVCIDVFSPGSEVELFLNGQSLGRKTVDKDFPKVTFETQYEKGTLKAVSYDNGSQIGEFELSTPKDEAHLTVLPEENAGSELIYVNIEYRDVDGILYQTCDKEISVSVSGEREFRIGSGNPKPDTNYIGTTTKVWNGRAQLIIRKAAPDDKVDITVNDSNETVNIQL